MKRTLLNIIILLISFWSYDQSHGVFIVPMSIEDRVNESTKIVESAISTNDNLMNPNVGKGEQF